MDLFEVRDPLAPRHLLRKDNATGGSIVDLVPSSHAPEHLFVGGGGQAAIVALDGFTLETLASLPVLGPHVIAVATSLLGSDVFACDQNSVLDPQFLYQYDGQTFEPVMQYPLEVRSHNGQAGYRGLDVERSSRKAFLVHGGYGQDSEFRVQIVDVLTTVTPAVPTLAGPGALLLLVVLAIVATLMIRRRAS